MLASCSDYFQSFIKKSKIQYFNTFIILAGVESKELEYILDYIYDGEVQLFQHDLDKFLDIAEKLKIKGLSGNQDENNVKSEKNLKIIGNIVKLAICRNIHDYNDIL